MTKNKNLEDLLLEKFNVYYSEYDGQYHNGRQADGTVPFQEAKEEILQSLLSLIGEEKTEYVEASDNDGHRYQIPSTQRDDWYKWCEIPADDERSWDTPSYAERIDGMPVTDNSGYNHALKDFRKLIREWVNK